MGKGREHKNMKRFIHVYVRHFILSIITLWYIHFYKMNIHKSVRISLKAKLDKTNPKGVHIGAGTYIAFGSVILTHDMCRDIHKDVRIGENCFIGGNSIIMPGVTLGDSCIVAAGAVVTKDVSSGTIVAGNPAVVIRENIKTKALGILINE